MSVATGGLLLKVDKPARRTDEVKLGREPQDVAVSPFTPHRQSRKIGN